MKGFAQNSEREGTGYDVFLPGELEPLASVIRVDKVCQDHQITGMATMNVSLPDPMKSWVESRTKDGRYSNVSDYVRDLIRKDQERERAVLELQGLIKEGIYSGAPRPFEMSGFIERKVVGHDN